MRGGPEAECLGKAQGWRRSHRGDTNTVTILLLPKQLKLSEHSWWARCCVFHPSWHFILIGAGYY